MSEGEVIFKRGSTAYFASSLFLNGQQRKDVARLYGFARTAKALVDKTPQRLGRLDDLVTVWQKVSDLPMRDLEASDQDDQNTRVSKTIARLKIMYGFDVAWVDAFLISTLMDAKPRTFKTLDDSLQYVYGSAEVLGLMMASLLRLPKGVQEAVRLQARAVQWITLVRDIEENNQLGRNYFPQEDLRAFKLKDLQEETAREYPERFTDFMHFQINRYHQWQQEAAVGLPYLPRRIRIAIQASTDGYNYTAKQIVKDPLTVYAGRVKPGRPRLLLAVVGHSFD
jgi:15-cis-phytoene synthase